MWVDLEGKCFAEGENLFDVRIYFITNVWIDAYFGQVRDLRTPSI